MSMSALRRRATFITGIALIVASALTAVDAHASGEHYGAAMNYRMHCEGCHKADGSGQPGYIPDLRDNVARFLATAEGRAYLARVPGTSQSLLADAERAEVLNWILATFDPAHLPADFVPYTGSELAQWRHDALSQPGAVRRRLLAAADASNSTTPQAPAAPSAATPVTAPAAFGICAACHTVSADGAVGMGPNLRGIAGRRAGTGKGFTYSPALRGSGITWDAVELDAFIRAPAAKVPGNYMAFGGLANDEDRKAIIEYLSSLR